MRFVLSNENQSLFLKCAIEQKNVDDSVIDEMVENCKYYVFEVHANCYFLSRDIQTRLAKEKMVSRYVSSVYQLVDDSNFYMEEISSDFVDFMLQQHSLKEHDLDTNILIIHQNYIARYE